MESSVAIEVKSVPSRIQLDEKCFSCSGDGICEWCDGSGFRLTEDGEKMLDHQIDWIILGRETPVSKKKTAPKIEWVYEIIEAADKANIPVFLKDNLKTLIDAEAGFNPDFYGYTDDPSGWESSDELRQEFPKVSQ